MPLISVIIPFKNETALLQQCLESLANQTFKNFEIILIGDGANPEAINIAQKFNWKHKLVLLIPYSQGQSNARNIALTLCTGKYIALLDADDYCHPKRFQLQLKAFSHNPKLEVCGTAATTVPKGVLWEVYTKQRNIYNQMAINNPFINSSLLIKREVFAGFKYNSQLDTAEDFDFAYFLIQTGKYVANIAAPLVCYFQGEKSADSRAEQKNKARSIRNRFLHTLSEQEKATFHLFCELDNKAHWDQIMRLKKKNITATANFNDQLLRFFLKHKPTVSYWSLIIIWVFAGQLRTFSVLNRLIKSKN